MHLAQKYWRIVTYKRSVCLLLGRHNQASPSLLRVKLWTLHLQSCKERATDVSLHLRSPQRGKPSHRLHKTPAQHGGSCHFSLEFKTQLLLWMLSRIKCKLMCSSKLFLEFWMNTDCNGNSDGDEGYKYASSPAEIRQCLGEEKGRETMKSVDLAGCQGNTAGVVPSGSWERRPCFCISSVPLKTVQDRSYTNADTTCDAFHIVGKILSLLLNVGVPPQTHFFHFT